MIFALRGFGKSRVKRTSPAYCLAHRVGEALRQCRAQGFRRARAGLQHDEAHDRLAVHLVRNADHAGPGYRVVADED
jgi:hypothetical protein